ncbi:MAG: ABC transporter permease [Anaerolineaceae bacterium]|nr:ABC transporter permease [Anaerolineaceae bacterium]
MKKYLIKRLLVMIPMIMGISLLSFFIINMAPGDPVMMFVDREKGVPSQQELARVRKILGLDKPVGIRYFYWLANTAKGDMGYSLFSRQPVVKEIQLRIGTTILISSVAMLISAVLGMVVGLICALNQYKLADYILSVLAFIGLSLPSFWLAMMLILLFTNKLGWLPSVGLFDVNLKNPTFFADVWDRIKHLILPITAMSLSSIGGWARYQRAAFLEVQKQDYIRTARSKGLNEGVISFRHAFRNAALPIITILGMSLPGLIGGAFLIESIFGLPGMGRLGINAIGNRDYPVIMAVTLFSSIMVLIGTFLADLTYALVDPRIRYN